MKMKKTSTPLLTVYLYLLVGLLHNQIHPTTAVNWELNRIFGRNDDHHDSFTKENDHVSKRKSSPLFAMQSYSALKQEQLAATKKNNDVRMATKVLLLTYGGMMLKGNMTFESMICAMIATKLIHKTNYNYSIEGNNIGWTLVSWISIIFSGCGTISNWMLNQIEKNVLVSSNVVQEGVAAATTPTTSTKPLVLSLLRVGSRSIELFGGTLVLFLLFLSW